MCLTLKSVNSFMPPPWLLAEQKLGMDVYVGETLCVSV